MGIKLWINNFQLFLYLSYQFTKWYLPVHFKTKRFATMRLMNLSLLWVFHFEIRLPLPFSYKAAGGLVSKNRYL